MSCVFTRRLGGAAMSEGRKQFSTLLSRFINLVLLALVIGLVVACGSSPLSPSPTSVSAGTSVPGGTALYTYRGHSSAVGAVAWSPDGKYIASGSDSPTTVRSGMRVMDICCSPIADNQLQLLQLPGHLMANTLLREAVTPLCKSGML